MINEINEHDIPFKISAPDSGEFSYYFFKLKNSILFTKSITEILNDTRVKKKLIVSSSGISFLLQNGVIPSPYTIYENLYVLQIGDSLKIPLVKNYGYLKNKKVDKLQSLSRYTISSGENLLSFFILECLSNNMKILIDKSDKNKVPILRDKFIKMDYNSSKSLKKIFKRK